MSFSTCVVEMLDRIECALIGRTDPRRAAGDRDGALGGAQRSEHLGDDSLGQRRCEIDMGEATSFAFMAGSWASG